MKASQISALRLEPSFLDCLSCPFCGGHLELSESDISTGLAAYGVLTCFCGRYPLVAGIPVLKKDATGTLDDVVGLIEVRQYQAALLTMISPASPTLASDWTRALPSGKLSRWARAIAHHKKLDSWQKRASNLLADQDKCVTACALFDLYFQRKDAYDYFAYRFAQPRHLVALSFATLIHEPTKPVLDLACGCGHLTYSLGQIVKNQRVIGIDEFFFGLYVAKHWIAPEADYVCCSADTSLPFADSAFSTAFCSDAFHYFSRKVATFREMKRVTEDDGLIILTWVHNALHRCPADGSPLTFRGYQELVGDRPHRLVADTDVLGRYLQKEGPPLARSATTEQLTRAPLLSVVASRGQAVFQDHESFEDWPHAQGLLAINPLFEVDDKEQNGYVKLRRRSPSTFFEHEHKDAALYLPDELRVPSAALSQLTVGKRTAEIERLIEQCVLVGMPARYQ